MQTESNGCKAVSTLEQAMECLESACSHCNDDRSDHFPCLNPEIKRICEGGEVRPTVVLSTLSQMMNMVSSTPAPQPVLTEPALAPRMMPMEPTPTPQMVPMEPTPTPQVMPMETPDTSSQMTSMEPAATPRVPTMSMDDIQMGMGSMGTMGDMPFMPSEVMSSEEPMEPSPEMSMESSPMPDDMPTFTPEYTPMSGEEAMMMDGAMPPMMMDETTVPPTMTDATTMPPMTEPPTTMPPMTEAMTEPPTTMPPTTTEAMTEPPTTTEPMTEPPTTMPPMTEPMTEPPTTMPPMTRSRCTYTGSNRVTISLGSVTPVDGWVRKSRGGLSGLVFRPDKNHGILKPGVEGEMCFSVRLSEPGDYHLTAVSAAPDRTENNDMWIKCSKPLTLIRKGVVNNGNTDWYKGYQNDGSNKIADHLKTVDNRGHDFVITNVRANENFNICISGRSYRYEVFKIIANKCDSARCLSGVSRRGSLINSEPSSCS
ncbi:hypothetical protein FGB62_89g09 [Gracilaria domingensis]|nr:hypothetical protein FGB62_89g09 [Gracilaria domingensis]